MKNGVYYIDDKIYIVISQSLMKKFVERGNLIAFCPKQIKEISIDKKYDYSSKSMDAGNYFESMAIGGTAARTITSMGKLKNGKVSVDQKRIDAQVKEFRNDKKKLQIDVDRYSVQQKFVKVFKLFDDDNTIVIFQGVTDIVSFCNFKGDYQFRIIDLKLTKDVTNTFGPFCWGIPDEMDHIQAYTYNWVIKAPFAYMIYDYKPSVLEKKAPLNVNISSTHVLEMNESIRKTVANMIEQELTGWKPIPNLPENNGRYIVNKCDKCIILDCIHKNEKQIN